MMQPEAHRSLRVGCSGIIGILDFAGCFGHLFRWRLDEIGRFGADYLGRADDGLNRRGGVNLWRGCLIHRLNQPGKILFKVLSLMT